MLDLRLIRRPPAGGGPALPRRGDTGRLDEVLDLDEDWRAATASAERLRAEQKAASDAIATAKRSGEDAGPLLERMRDMSAQVKSLTERARTAEERLQCVLATLPNLPDPGAAPEDTVIRIVGEPQVREGRDHLELAGEMIDMERAARLSGSRFAYLRGGLVMLEFALVRWALDKLAGHGFEPVIPPVLVREHALYGTGFLPDTEQQIYRLPDDDLYLVGTSEVALASLHAGEILDGADLPRRYAGFSTCFRREPDAAPDEHERLLAIEEEILQGLGIPYRVVNIAVDDLGSSAAKKYDCEAWLPSQQRFRELTSTSNTTDYQARRLEIRHRVGGSGKPEILHTLNGTAVAVGRTLIAMLENGQREDGSIAVPEVLHAWGAPRELRVGIAG